jgi:hypothetical protein
VTGIASGWFALGGSLVVVAGTQVGAIISARSKSQARKLKYRRQDMAAKATTRRDLYEHLISRVDKAEALTARVLISMEDKYEEPMHYGNAVTEVLGPVRSACISVQIYGSEEARTIATELLDATQRAWLQATLWEGEDVDQGAVAAANSALERSYARIVEVARQDFGGVAIVSVREHDNEPAPE